MERRALGWILGVAVLGGTALAFAAHSCGGHLERLRLESETQEPPEPTAKTTAGERPAPEDLARRIVVLSPAVAEILFDIGAGDRIVGVTRYATYPPQVQELPRVGGVMDISFERITALEPDLILAQTGDEKIRAFAARRGVRFERLVIERIADVRETVRLVSRLVGLVARGEALVARIDRDLEEVRREFAGRDPVSCYLAVDRRPGVMSGMLTVGRDTFIDELVKAVGGRNVFADLARHYPTVSKEAIVARRPEVILELRPGASPDDEAVAGMIRDWNPLAGIPAVGSGRVRLVTHSAALLPCPRLAEVAREIGRALHGDPGSKERP